MTIRKTMPAAVRITLGVSLLLSVVLTSQACVTAGARTPGADTAATPGNNNGAIRERDLRSSLRTWEKTMRTQGKAMGEYLLEQPTYELRLHATYYDSNRIFRQIAHYTGEKAPWDAFATFAESAYREYMSRNDYGVAGWMRFPHGFYMAGMNDNDREALLFLIRLRDKGAFADPDDKRRSRSWHQQRYSREVAYLIQTHVLAEKAGAARKRERLAAFVDMALGHVAIWTTGDFISTDRDWHFVQPFMAGITASALIDYYELTSSNGEPDNRLPAALHQLADWLWANAWIEDVGGEAGRWNDRGGSGYGAFRYVIPAKEAVGSNNPSPDLNMLILPLYIWLFEHTGDVRYLHQADRIFVGGVQLASLVSPKHFNQHYRDSFGYVKLRSRMLDED